jgi:hypothetical protein
VDTGEAFKVARIDHVEGGLIAASGRAYRDLHIGDILESQPSRKTASGQSAEFTVAGITTYGRTVQSLGRMLTGVLLLRGRGGHVPRVELLFIKEPASRGMTAAHQDHRRTGEPD